MKKIIIAVMLLFSTICYAENFSEQEILNAAYTYQTKMAYNAVTTTQIDYVGISAPGTADTDTGWQIKKLTYDGSGNVTSITFADNTAAFTKKWSLRTTYTY